MRQKYCTLKKFYIPGLRIYGLSIDRHKQNYFFSERKYYQIFKANAMKKIPKYTIIYSEVANENWEMSIVAIHSYQINQITFWQNIKCQILLNPILHKRNNRLEKTINQVFFIPYWEY